MLYGGFFPPFVFFTMFVLLRMITSPCQGLITLVDNHLCHLMLKPILPQLQSHIHDTSEKVRVAMVNLLLKIKGVRAIKVSFLGFIISYVFLLKQCFVAKLVLEFV